MGYPPPSIIKVAEFWRDFRRYYHLRPVEFNDRCMAQIMGYVKTEARKMTNVYSLRADQTKDFSQRFFLKIYSVIVDKWEPGKGANIYSYGQRVGELTKCNIAREIIEEHNRELDLAKAKRMTSLSGERMNSKRDWENDEVDEGADASAALIDSAFKDQFAAADVKLDWEYAVMALTPKLRHVADLLWEYQGNVAAVREHLGVGVAHKRAFETKVIRPIRAAFSERYLGLAKGEIYVAKR